MADIFLKMNEALRYIDEHLSDDMSLETLSLQFHFSPYYFHRMFSAIAGKTLAVYVRDRRLMYACVLLSTTNRSVLDIGLCIGYDSAQAFSRAFKAVFGLPPTRYRAQGLVPVVVTVDDLVTKFTNRLKGGIVLNPNIIKREELLIAGVSGPGSKTWEVWNAFEQQQKEKPLTTKTCESGYEIRLYEGDSCTVHVGFAVADDRVDSSYEIFRLPASHYASFDVFVANGYDSENTAMDEWLRTNAQGYTERLLSGRHYCVEYYDERFSGSEAGSIVEIWIPIQPSAAANSNEKPPASADSLAMKRRR